MVNLVVSDRVLLGDEDGTGWVEGYGEVPGDLDSGSGSPTTSTPGWMLLLRRL